MARGDSALHYLGMYVCVCECRCLCVCMCVCLSVSACVCLSVLPHLQKKRHGENCLWLLTSEASLLALEPPPQQLLRLLRLRYVK